MKRTANPVSGPSAGEIDQLVALSSSGRLAELENLAGHLSARYPDSGLIWKLLGQSRYLQGKDALPALEKAAALLPDDVDALNNLGIALTDNGQTDDAVATCRKALKIRPDDPRVLNTLGNALSELGQAGAAVAAFRRALQIKPDYAKAYNNLGKALDTLGQPDAAVDCFRQALKLNPDYPLAFSALLMMMQYTGTFTNEEIFSAHKAYAQRFETPLKRNWQPHSNPRDPAKRLKIGYVSPDFRRHSVAYFLEPVLARHDPDRFEIYCYYNHARTDEVTRRLQSLADHWRDIRTLSDDDTATLIRQDGIDILVDLAGHTTGNRLPVFCRKPAPVQASWLGYPSSTGLSAMDYRITDIHADPAGMSERYYSEVLYRLPDTTACFSAADDAPETVPHPAREQAGITFGSFNNFSKVNPAVRTLWARILLAVPHSRLMLKDAAFTDAETCRKLVSEFEALGIAPERIKLVTRDISYREHMNRYNQIDIGLDPFPYNGVTTSAEAMWMGVPVVTLAGNSFGSRMGVSLLSCTGMTELIAATPEEYVAIASRLAGDINHLEELRCGLRTRVMNSPLLDARRFTENLEQAYRNMWQAYVNGMAART